MPHKHKRRRTDDGASFDLAPSSVAKPLPAFHKVIRLEASKQRSSKNGPNKPDKVPSKVKDDTPRAFARLLSFQQSAKRPTHILDDGNIKKGKKQKDEGETPGKSRSMTKDVSTSIFERSTTNIPDVKILPGERLNDFAARVDQALPIAGLQTKGQCANMKIPGLKEEERKTKHNRRLERMQKEWREEDLRRKEKLDEKLEEEEEERERQQLIWEGVVAGGGKKKKRKGDVGAVDQEDDPWAELEQRRRETRQKTLQDVVQAPPQLKGVKRQLKAYDAAVVDVGNVPGSVVSLRKREELGAARRIVIEEYRKMMTRKNQVVKV